MVEVKVDEVFATPLTEEEQAKFEAELELANSTKRKEEALANLKVTVNGKVFYADTDARIDIADAISTAEDKGIQTTIWKLAEEYEGSRYVSVTVDELKEAKYLALQAKAKLVGVQA